MNLHGRVWIGNLILFGLAGAVIIYIVNPVLYKGFDFIPLLNDEASASDDMKKLKAETDRQKGRLEAHAFVKYPYGRQ